MRGDNSVNILGFLPSLSEISIFSSLSLCIFFSPASRLQCFSDAALSLSSLEDKCALSCVLLEVKTSEAASQVPEAQAGFVVYVVCGQ